MDPRDNDQRNIWTRAHPWRVKRGRLYNQRQWNPQIKFDVWFQRREGLTRRDNFKSEPKKKLCFSKDRLVEQTPQIHPKLFVSRAKKKYWNKLAVTKVREKKSNKEVEQRW